jgi:gas vesicle protein
MKLKFIHGVIAGAIIAIFFAFDSCKATSDLQRAINDINSYSDSVKIEKTKNGTLLAYNNSLSVSLDALKLANDSLSDYLDNIKVKDPEVITVIETVSTIDTIKVPINVDSCEFNTSFSIDSTYYSISGNVTNEELSINELSINNKMALVVGYKKEKWWKKKEAVATVTNSNPHINVVGISSFNITEEMKWYQKDWFKITIGAVAGATAVMLLNK